jgi:hypothetical protein
MNYAAVLSDGHKGFFSACVNYFVRRAGLAFPCPPSSFVHTSALLGDVFRFLRRKSFVNDVHPLAKANFSFFFVPSKQPLAKLSHMANMAYSCAIFHSRHSFSLRVFRTQPLDVRAVIMVIYLCC